MTQRLSKSKILSGWQCPRRLWLEIQQPDLAEADPAARVRMDTGRQAGELAWSLMPGGTLVEYEPGLTAALTKTRELLAQPGAVTIYEATFEHDGVLVRCDLLRRDDDGLHLAEVKSSTKVEQYHIVDCAVQLQVLEACGLPVRELFLAHIDNQFVYPGDGTYDGLFKMEDVQARSREFLPEIPRLIEQCRQALVDGEPAIEMGGHCEKPFSCPFQAHCTPSDAPEYPVSDLPRISRKRVEELEALGWRDIRDIPAGVLRNENRERVRRVTIYGRPELLPGAKAKLNALGWPRFYLDFETIQFAVPIWAGTRPYEQLPFQWSCHVERAPGKLKHFEFLDTSGRSPMLAFAESMIDVCGNAGPILVYNATFGKSVIKNCMSHFPDLKSKLESISERIVDLLPIMRDNYYHPALHGSWSFKAVLPCAVPELDYAKLDGVHDGEQAQQAYLEAIAPETIARRKVELER